MSYVVDNIDSDLTQEELLSLILLELKKLNIMVSEMSDVHLNDGDVE